MRLTLVALLGLCGIFCTGCESLNKTARWSRKDPAMAEQLANDQQRREAAEQELTRQFPPTSPTKAIQQTSFSPSLPDADSADAALLKALKAEEARQPQVARSLYEQVLAQQPQNAKAHHRLGVLADQEGRYQDAQQHYQVALQQQPQNASLLSDIGYSFYSQDRLDEAEHYLQSAIQLQPDNQYARNNLAQVYGRRAQQTGSSADYKLAQEQMQMAAGPQAAPQFQQPSAQQPTAERRNLLNPFKKRGDADKTAGRLASTLQAPEPRDDGNAALFQQMERIRAEMEARGELAPRRLGDGSLQGAAANSNRAPVPFNQINDELTRIDTEASRQQAEALRRGYPAPSRTPDQYANAIHSGDIERVGWEQGPGADPRDSRSAQGSAYGPQSTLGYGPQGQPGLVDQSRGPGRRGANDPYPGASYFGADPQSQSPVNPGANGNPNEAMNAPVFDQTWPTPQGGATQFDARGQAWSGQVPLMATQGNAGNGAYDPKDPTYNTGGGRSFGPQRPNQSSRAGTSPRGQTSVPQGGWDEGRQAAAQLGLDAGMGDMFPAGPGETGAIDQYRGGATNGNWANSPNQGQGGWQGGDQGYYGNATTPRGMPQGGSGMVAPADYSAAPPNFQNTSYSQGINPTMGDNFGNAGTDVSAPWNQPGMSPRNSRPGADGQFSNDASHPTGRFAPSRQSNQPQNFGAPPMYYGSR